MKKIVSLLLFAILLIIPIANISAASANLENKVILSEQSEQDCIDFIISRGVIIPEDLKSPTLGSFVKTIITATEKDPNWPFAASYTVTHDFIEQIRKVVNNYYNIKSAALAPSAYVLQDSTVIGPWKDSYLNYNCYGYAINNHVFRNPGYHSGQAFDIDYSIYQMALLVRDDLNALDNDCVKITSLRPDSESLAVGQKAICIRKGSEDYHFMKLDNDIWYHKPGNTAVLKYNYLPTDSLEWSNELSFRGVAYAPTIYYDSDIYYIIYTSEHDYRNTWTGNHYHSGKRHYYEYADICEQCGDTINITWESKICNGPPCALPWFMPIIIEK